MCVLSGMTFNGTDEGDVVVNTGASNIGALFFQALTFSLLIIFCLIYRREIARYLRYATWPLCLAFLAMVSTLWSIDPGFTFRRSIPLIMGTFAAFCIGVDFDPQALSNLYKTILQWMVYISVLVVVLVPSLGISHGVHSGDWKGAFYHKNKLGMMMAMAVITFVVARPEKLRGTLSKGLTAMAALLALVLLYKSHASSAIISLAAAVAAQPIWYLFQLRKKVVTVALLLGYPLAAVVMGLIIAYSSQVFAMLGKDATLSGRDTLWAGVLDAIRLRPVLGYGYGAFWNQVGGTIILVRERTTFQAIHAHNGYLNLMLHLGVVGLVVFLVFLIRCVVLSIQEGRRIHNMPARWYFTFIVYMVVTNLTESQIIEQWYFLWLTLVAFYVTFSIERSQRSEAAEALPIAVEQPSQLSLATS